MLGNKPPTAIERAVHVVNRLAFLPPLQQRHADDDTPLPIGYGQTTSQPSLIEEMTRELAIAGHSRVLEVGTGSGYQTAILAEIAAQVYTIERIPELAKGARDRLEALGYRNIHFRVGDGSLGWREAAPFDAIIVTAAPADVPPALTGQLANGGRMVIPVGPGRLSQVLVLVTKDANGHVTHRELFGVMFVPLICEAEP